jgi:FMN-dependent NADH-azoreductase
MRLIEVFNNLLEADAVGETDAQKQEDTVLEFPHQNFTVSIVKTGKKLFFTPQQHSSITTQMKSYVDKISENFLVLNIKEHGEGAFEIEIDPREDFDAVIEFVQGQLDGEREI